MLAAGAPPREVWHAWNAKEVDHQINDHSDSGLAAEWIDAIAHYFTDSEMLLKVRRLGRTITRWRNQIVAWHQVDVSNGPTEAVNNLAKRVKRVAFGFRRFDHYRIRMLPDAGRPKWDPLDTVTPR